MSVNVQYSFKVSAIGTNGNSPLTLDQFADFFGVSHEEAIEALVYTLGTLHNMRVQNPQGADAITQKIDQILSVLPLGTAVDDVIINGASEYIYYTRPDCMDRMIQSISTPQGPDRKAGLN